MQLTDANTAKFIETAGTILDVPVWKRRPRPLGEKLPKDAAELIEQIAPETPDTDLTRQITDALLGRDVDGKPPALLRRRRAGEILLTWLNERGGFIRDETNERYYFYRDRRKLFSLESDEWAAWLYAVTGANPAGTDYAYLATDCKASATVAPRRQVVRIAAWDSTAEVLRVSRFDGTVYVLDGETITEEANGENVLFDDNPAWQPYEPVFNGSGALHWHTTELPNWTDETREMLGLAFRAWIVASFLTELCPTRPLLVMLGEKGSGKTMTLRLLLRFLFGPMAEVSGVPDKPDGFTAAAAAAHVLVLDNLDDFRGWLRDKLARLATGGIDEYRRLYTSNDVGRVRYRCWLAFTARTPDTLRRDDLVDRLLILPVERIASESLQAERLFLQQADLFRNEWWGAVLTALNGVVAAIRRCELKTRSALRMADWESVGRLLAEQEGKAALWDQFIGDLQNSQAEFLLESDLLVDGLNLWLADSGNHGREVTARELHLEMTGLLFGDKRPPSDWPKSASGFGRRLKGIYRELKTLFDAESEKATSGPNRERQVYRFSPKAE
jgi:hypothetical protein